MCCKTAAAPNHLLKQNVENASLSAFNVLYYKGIAFDEGFKEVFIHLVYK